MSPATETNAAATGVARRLRRIGLIGALDVEIKDLVALLSDRSEQARAHMRFQIGGYRGLECVVVQASVGKVAAACCAQVLISEFHVDAIVFSGIAGAAKSGVKPGDIVISTDTVQHDVDTTHFGDRRGDLGKPSSFAVAADLELRRLALAAANAASFEGIEPTIHEGRILTGDQFIANHKRVAQLGSDFDGLAVEMEGAAVAQVAAWNQVPFVILRSISDSGDGDDKVYWDFRSVAAHNSARVVRGLLDSLATRD